MARGVPVQCIQCGTEFRVTPSRVSDAKFCSQACYGLHGRGPAPHELVSRDCAQCGATFQVRPKLTQRFCSKRCAYDAGTASDDDIKGRRLVFAPNHPLCTGGKTRTVSAQRLALYEKIGPGVHACHWCSREVEWTVGKRGGGGRALVADHLDGNWRDNSPTNLVPACQACNAGRAKTIQDSDVYITRLNSNGKMGRVRAIDRACEECGAQFRAVKAEVAKGKGRFCSRECVGAATMRERLAAGNPPNPKGKNCRARKPEHPGTNPTHPPKPS